MLNTQFTYQEATTDTLTQIWDKNIRNHPGDDRWIAWKAQFLSDNQAGKCKTFLILADGNPIGEGTLLFSPECSAIAGRYALADGSKTANINALRIEKAYEGQGHISRLISVMESYAKAHGYTSLTIGVEAKETRNLAIYLHWNYSDFILAEMEEGELVLYYAKPLTPVS